MRWRHAPILRALPAMMGMTGILTAGPAFAIDRDCQSMAVGTDASVHTRWPDLSARVRAAFEARDDIDRCARITLTMGGGAITVNVVLPDGRSTWRSVARKEDVVPALEGLLLLPWDQAPRSAIEPAAGPAPAQTALRPPAREVPAAADLTVVSREAPARSPADPHSRLRLELSVATGAQIGDGRAGLGGGVLSIVDIGGWLAGFEGRVDVYDRIADGPPVGAFKLGALGGRRFRSGTLALDLVAGPAWALQGTTKSTKQVGSTDPGVTTSAFGMSARLRAGAHLHFRALSTLRAFIGLDADVGRAPSAAALASDLGGLPTWTVGLALGATVGTR